MSDFKKNLYSATDRLMEKTEGLLRQDVRAMLQIWNEYDSDIRNNKSNVKLQDQPLLGH